MATSGIQVVGLNQVVRNLQRLGVESEDLKAAFQRIGGKAERYAEGQAPKRTGRLAASIRQSKRKNSVYLYAGYNSKRLPYAGVIHFGWPKRNIAANPFLYRTVSALSAETVRDLEREMQTLIDRKGL